MQVARVASQDGLARRRRFRPLLEEDATQRRCAQQAAHRV